MTETGKPIPEVAEEPGVHPGTLHSWVSRARRNGSPTSDRSAKSICSPVVCSATRWANGATRNWWWHCSTWPQPPAAASSAA
ncbi:hypothetical protein [Streptomyces sp. NPDC001292]|uniref:hypothetical protein n=1 Tax=Streptomyces sp. NPDC001292 TaxID=3364558 RepID=UPI0036CC96AD